MSVPMIRPSLAVSVLCCVGIFGLIIVGLQQRTLANSLLQANKATSKTLGGAERYLTFISTDKPIYKSGEKVYVRGVLLNAANHKPLSAANAFANATVEIKGPKGDVIASGNAAVQNSVWSFSWDVPDGQAGGEYLVHATYPWNGHAPAERKFDIRSYRAPRLKSQITFLRDGYAPGDKVKATLEVTRAEGGFPEGAKVSVTANVDGKEIVGDNARVDAKGLCSVTLELPRQIPKGEGTMALVIEDGGVVETASKTIPILLQTVDLQVYPEGGDLVAGYKNRVYIQAKQPNGKPADLVARLMSKQSSRPIAEFHTEHEGRGRFEFTPNANGEYFLSILQPAGIKTIYKLPHIKKQGALLRSERNTYKAGQPISLKVGSTEKSCRVTLSKLETEIAAQKFPDLKAGILRDVSLDVPANVDGVLTATVWNEKGIPIAERLVFREPAEQLKISIKPDKKSYSPGEKAKVTIRATDSHDKPISAVVGLTVTDDSVLEMVEKREQAARLPVMVFLESEVKDLADAHVYMDQKNPKAPLATDLLLATQGWRRFALMDLTKFISDNGDDARRVVALKIQSQAEINDAAGEADDAAPMALAAGVAGAGGAMPGDFRRRVPVPGPILKALAPVPKAALAMAAFQASPMVAQQNAMPMAKGNFGAAAQVPVGLAQMPMNAPRQAKDINLLDNRPIIHDFREAPENKQKEEIGAADSLQVAIMRHSNFDKKRMIGAPTPHSSTGNLVWVREFAHQVRKNRKPTDRLDFADTLYWNAGVKTDAKTGEATINFGLNDSVSTFRVFADGFSSTGAVAANNICLQSVQPFYAEAKLPLEVTAGDRVLLPINLVNATTKPLDGADLNVSLKGDFKLPALQKNHTNINAGQRVRWIQTINVGSGNGLKDFSLTAKAGSFEDKVTRKLSVKPKGFPIEVSFGGLVSPEKPIVQTITIPKGVVAASIESNAAVYPTPLANMTEALQRMIQDPYGCFEQTSSTSYPLTMAQQYFLSHTGVDPKLVESSREKLDAGYKRLVGFWCPDKGYEWFGENPGHEALTAFGILHFNDMAKVRDVDQNMVASTRAWLLKQKDGQGGFTRKRRSLHTWIEDKDCSNAYIVWALLETGQPASDLKAELASLKSAAEVSKNNYVVALAANAFELSGDKGEAHKLMDRLAAKQKTDGSLDGVTSSIVGSGGESLEVEGTSLATLAWLREPDYAGNVEHSIKFLADSCQAGRYGSTQATVLALRAIVNYDKQRSKPKAPGKLRLYVDGQSIGDWVEFDKSTQGAIKLPDMSELLSPGQHKLELRMQGGASMPYSLAVKYNAITPASSKDCKLNLTVKLAQNNIAEGAATQANVTVVNNTKEVLPTPVAIVGLPGGMEPRHDQLKELVKKGTIDAYEVRGREVVLYWRTIAAQAKLDVPISLIAAVPGTYTGPASRAYLYYTDEHKQWVDGLRVEITAK